MDDIGRSRMDRLRQTIRYCFQIDSCGLHIIITLKNIKHCSLIIDARLGIGQKLPHWQSSGINRYSTKLILKQQPSPNRS